MKQYVSVTYSIEDAIDREVLSYKLDLLNVESIQDTDDGIIAYILEEVYLENRNKFLALRAHKVDRIENKNWNAEWEANFTPVRIEDFCLVRAPFHNADTSCKYEIILEPRMAFGTAHHETTYMMMLEMKSIDFADKKVFDYGCGTAILAILAERMGASHIYAIDYDENAVENAKYNVEINGCHQIQVEKKELSSVSEHSFDVVLANINKAVLRESAHQLLDIITHEGILLLSGILVKDEVEIKNLYGSAGFRWKKTEIKGDWVCMKFQA